MYKMAPCTILIWGDFREIAIYKCFSKMGRIIHFVICFFEYRLFFTRNFINAIQFEKVKI